MVARPSTPFRSANAGEFSPAAGGRVRYTATITGESWNEVGDLIAEGQPPRRIFEMNLKRIGDSDWPEAGALTAE